MKIKEAADFFKGLISGTKKKSEIRVYEKFIGILSSLKNKDLTEGQLQSIENKLDTLQLNKETGTSKKYTKKQLGNFEKYLKKEFSFIMEGYYTALGMSFGLALGTALGTMADRTLGIAYGTSFGMMIGLFIGVFMDAEAKKQGRVLQTKPQ